MPSSTSFIGLTVFDDADAESTDFFTYWKTINFNGDANNLSAFQKIDDAYAAISDKITVLENRYR